MGQLNEQTGGLPTVTGSPWAGVRYFCTTRNGGVSRDAWASLNLGLHTRDEASHVLVNRQRLRAILPAEPVWLQQVHGTHVFDADVPSAGRGDMPVADVPVADAAVTTQPGRVLAIMTADCLPVVIAGGDGRSLGLAHAGWRGLAGGVLEATLAALRARTSPGTPWRAWIGPAISQRYFEVGNDVLAAFIGADPEASRFFIEKTPGLKWLADLPGLARHRLYKAGVESVALSGECTYALRDRYFSYRRDAETGRIATVAWLE
jgi:YfiH family protein